MFDPISLAYEMAVRAFFKQDTVWNHTGLSHRSRLLTWSSSSIEGGNDRFFAGGIFLL